MKNFAKVFALLFLSIITFSCDNESINETISINEQQLTSITEIVTIGSNQPITWNYTINEDLNTQIESNNGSNQMHTYTDDKVTLIESFYNGTASKTETFTYDSNDRIVASNTSLLETNEEYSYEFDYIGNQIFGTKTSSENGSVIQVENYTFTLNNNNQIVNYQNEDNSFSWSASYENGNLMSYSNTGEEAANATFTYSQELASEPYQKERYRFGTEWRNNIMIFQRFKYSFKQLAELGSNYLTGYSYILNSDNSEVISLSAEYEFDSFGRLALQTKNKIFYNFIFNRVLSYQYQ